MWQQLLEWDRDTFVYLNSLGIESYDGFWYTITHITTWIPLYLFFIFMLFYKYSKKEALYRALTVLGLLVFVLVLTKITKEGVARLRPNNTEEINTIIRILHTPTDYSFFSGHASSSFSLTVLMYLFLRKKVGWALSLFLWPILFAMSRIYVGVHYPLDIIVGALVGIFSGILFYKLYKCFIAPYSKSTHPE